MGLSHSPRIITDGLVLCVDAANKRSYPGTGTTWTDLVGGNNGTLTNGPTFSSDNRGGIQFDGTDDSVLLDNDIILGNASSITVWVRDLSSNGVIAGTNFVSRSFLASVRLGRHTLISSWPSDDPSETWGGLWFTYHWDAIATDTSNTWTHLSISRDGLIAYFYINGVANLMDSSCSGPCGDNGYLVSNIGGGTGYAATTSGRIAGLQIYNRALTDDEVGQNYNATRGRFQ